MQNAIFDDSDKEHSENKDTGSGTLESDNAWQLKSVPDEEFRKWQTEKERYDEIIEYIREVDEILNLIRPFPRDEKVADAQKQNLVRSDSQSQSSRLDHLENIIKLVEQLKELQENNYRFSERTCLKDLKKLREYKKRLKDEEIELRSRTRARSTVSPEDFEEDFIESLSKARKISSTASEKLETETEGWQHKRKSLCLPNTEEQKSKVSKWTKVKEAFHWEKASTIPKPDKKEIYNLELPKLFTGEGSDYRNLDDGPSTSALDGLLPPPPPVPPRTLPSRPEDLLSVRQIQDFPSSSSSDRLDEFFCETFAKGNKTPDADSSSQQFGLEDNDEADDRMRKSSSGEFPQHLCKEELTARSTKSNKTTWGKVKDIIQTRKDSLKKKPKKRGSDEFKKRRKLSTLSTSQFSDQFEDLSSPEEKLKNSSEVIPKTGGDYLEDPTTVSQSPTDEKCQKKLMPALTVTLPSTEELRSFSCEDLDKRETGDYDKTNILGHFSCQAQYCEDKTKFGKSKTGQNQRLSRWVKVKRVFLTSASSSRPANYSPGNDSSPTSQNKSSGFFSDMESDEVSSGEWIDDKSPTHETKPRLGETESQSAAMTLIQEDIRKSYNELQKKLSQEFDQKLREWEIKSEVKSEDAPSKGKVEDGDSIPKFRKSRDSMAVPLPNLNDLSPEFKKKLNDWKKMKTSQSSSSVSSSTTKEEIQGQNIKIRIGEWQPWRSRCSQKIKPDTSEDSSKKSEGDKVRGSRPPSNRRKDKEGAEGTMRRDSKRRDSVKKISHSRTSSGGESLLSIDKDGRFIRRAQKVKDFQWVEKELQKIEREKLRLEQEKEKYLEREARLEKMKRTMGTAGTPQEILVRTPAGFFRFKGISQKFTKKLYEWEKARGIAPEASTFALLEESARTSTTGDFDCDGGVALQRSISTGSVPELSSALLIQTMAHHPSSLSLNDVDELKSRDDDHLDESISSEQIKLGSEEPEAIIVDVEDIVEETALLADAPLFQGEVPVYSYAEDPQKITPEENIYFSSGNVKIIKETEIPQDFEMSSSCSKKVLETKSVIIETNTQTLRNEVIEVKQEDAIVHNVQDTHHIMKTLDDTLHIPIQDFKPKPQALKAEEITVPRSKPPKEETTCVIETPAPVLAKSPKTFFDWASDFDSSTRRKILSQGSENLNVVTTPKPDPEALKKKIREKIALMQKMSSEPHWKHAELEYLRMKSCFTLDEKNKENIVKVDRDLDVVFNPHQRVQEEKKSAEIRTGCGVNVFVPTSRKIISPVRTTQGTTPSVCSYVIDDVKSEESQDSLKTSERGHSDEPRRLECKPQSDPRMFKSKSSSPSDAFPTNKAELEKKKDIGIPPLPNSPKSFKKLNAKETAPSIRMIIAKYNQKISEHDRTGEKGNESGSPIWRSPVFGRRTQEKIEMYTRNGEVQKSASLDNMRSIPHVSSLTPPRDSQIKGILKSSSVGVMKVRAEGGPPLDSDTVKETSPSVLRALKIQKAKEDFLSGKLGGSYDPPITTSFESSQAPESLPSISTDDSDQCLAKSVSVETITGETSSTKNDITEEKALDVKPLQKSSSKFDISSIKSKFRKMRMRKEKDPKLNAVAVLCRQSLLIEVPKNDNNQGASVSKSCPSSPVMDRNKNDKSKETGNRVEKKSK